MKSFTPFKTLRVFMPLLLMAFFNSSGLFAQTTIFEEHFTNLATGSYSTVLSSTTSFDNTTGWTYKNITAVEAAALCIGKSGSSGAYLQSPAIDLSGTVTISFKVKYYGTSSITGSTSSTINVLVGGSSGTTILAGAKGTITTPSGGASYSSTGWTQYSITLTTGTSGSNIYFKGGGSSGYAYEIDDIVVTKAATASLAVSQTSLSGFTYPQGSGPSTAQSFTVSGTTLTAGSAITITAPTNYEVSTDGTNYASTATIANTAGGTLAATTVYVRLASGLSQNSSITGNITVSGGGASTAPTIALTGSVTAPIVPTLIVSPSSLTGFTYVLGSGPSTAQSFNLSGTLLVAGSAITVTAPSNYEVSLSSGSGYASSVTITNSAGGTLAATPIYARLKSGLSINTYTGSISVSGGGASASQSVSLSGSVVATPLTAPTVGSPSTATEDGFTAAWSTVTNATGYIVNVYQGSTLTKTVTVSGQTSTSTTITGLSSSTAYTYKVIAVGDGTNYSNSDESASSTSITTATSSIVIPPTCDITLYETDFTDWTAVTATSSSGNAIAAQTTGGGKGYILTEDMTVTPSAGKLTSSSSERAIIFPAYTFVAGGKVIVTITSGSNNIDLELTGSGSDGSITSTATLISGTGTASITGTNTIALPKTGNKYQVVYTLPSSVVGSKTLTLAGIRNEISGISICTSAGTTTPTITTYPQPEITESTSALIGGNTSTITMLMKGYNLTGDVTLSIVGSDSLRFSLPVTTIAQATASNWKNIAITYTSSVIAKTHNAQLKLSSPGATDVYVDLVGVSQAISGTTPQLIASTDTLGFWTNIVGKTTNTLSIAGVNLTGDVTLSVTGTNASRYTLSTSTITSANATSGTTITITYVGDVYANTDYANLVISSPGATSVTVPLKSITSVIKPTVYALNVTLQYPGAGTVSKNPSAIKYVSGSSVLVTITLETGWKIKRWSDASGNANSKRTITVSEDKNLIVYLEAGTQTDTSNTKSDFVAYVPTAVTTTGFTASWASVTGATLYTITVYDASGNVVQTLTSSTNSISISSLALGTPYSYKVETTISGANKTTGKVGPFKTAGTSSTFVCGQ